MPSSICPSALYNGQSACLSWPPPSHRNSKGGVGPWEGGDQRGQGLYFSPHNWERLESQPNSLGAVASALLRGFPPLFFYIIKNFFYCGKKHNIKFTILSLQFSSVKYICIVVKQIFFILQMKQNFSSCKSKNLQSMKQLLPFSNPLDPGNLHPASHFYEVDYLHISNKWNRTMSFCHWLILLSIISSRFIFVEGFPSLLRLNNIPLYVYATLSIHLSMVF